MHAIVNQGGGKYYISPVFGYYKDIISADENELNPKEWYSSYCIVWDESRSHLIKWYTFQQNTNCLILQILITDSNQDGWVVDEDGIGGVDFLPKSLADEIIESQVMPDEIFEKCKNIDLNYTYDAEPEIKNDTDIENLYCVSNGFHDAYVKKCEEREDGSLYVLFTGVWGCSTIMIQDGFVYLIDEEDMTVEEINDSFCWFKARHMKYHVIPN